MAERVSCSYRNVLSVQNRVCCLYRVSTTKQVDSNEQNQADIPVQRKACHEFIDKMGWTLVREEQEAGVSGFKVSANDRDKIQLIKEYAERGEFDILLVFMFDRLGRRAEETPFVVEWFINHNIRVWSVNEGEQRIDSHVDRLTNYIRFWQADGESQKTAMRVKAAMGQMVQEGRFRGGSVPYGYMLVPSGQLNKRKREIYNLAVNEEEAKVVRLMFDLCIGSGYGRCKIATYLNDNGIKYRDGKNWHFCTVGNILKNITYTGVLKSGDTHSDVFPELQIITPAVFNLAQKLIDERKNDSSDKRSMPLNIRGKSLLSGNIFCGHCGGRLTLTTNGTARVNASGERTVRKRIRYVCYNKTRKIMSCTGPTGYTSHRIDEVVTRVLHMVFDRMQAVQEDEIIARTYRNAVIGLNKRVDAAKKECAKATREYEALKDEIVKGVQGHGKLPLEVLYELVAEARTKMLEANERLSLLSEEMEQSKNKREEIQNDFHNILKWAEMFDRSEMAVKKMIAGHIIKRVDVYADYKLHFVFNMNFAQFELGVDFPGDYELPEELVS